MVHLYKQEKLITVKSVLTAVVSFFCVVLLCLFVSSKMSTNIHEDEMTTLENALSEVAVLCYSVEGKYPDTVEYMEKNYGITYDHDKYWISYSIFGSNVPPEIHVYQYQ